MSVAQDKYLLCLSIKVLSEILLKQDIIILLLVVVPAIQYISIDGLLIAVIRIIEVRLLPLLLGIDIVSVGKLSWWFYLDS